MGTTATHWTRFWKVDEVIECITGVYGAHHKELLDVAPGAYDGGGVKMTTAWRKLKTETRRQLIDLYEKEYA